MNKLILVIALVGMITIIVINSKAYAHHHHTHEHAHNYLGTECTGVASSQAAAALQFGVRTQRPQVAIGLGGACDKSAIASGVAKRLGKGGPLLSGSLSSEESLKFKDASWNVGISWGL